ncbi:hypothetical protein [Rhodococcus erythropolis]|uniref:hypothetical protein n=1 Tax=Rhodococcus erythropolis TaxID=1833 RepID=UPI001F3F1866|nr:hypothetical protein [Rhodococcus erythropolis]
MMSPRNTWLSTRSAELRALLLDLGLTITDAEAQTILDDKVNEYTTLMRVSRQTAQRSFGDEHLARFAQSLALSISDEAPGANLVEFERAISMSIPAVGLTTAAVAEALKVAHANLNDSATSEGLSHLSILGMITAEASAFLVPVPRPLLLRIARFLDMASTSVKDGANLPEGLEEAGRPQFAEILSVDADGIRTIANNDSDDAPTLWRTPNPR